MTCVCSCWLIISLLFHQTSFSDLRAAAQPLLSPSSLSSPLFCFTHLFSVATPIILTNNIKSAWQKKREKRHKRVFVCVWVGVADAEVGLFTALLL